MASSARMFGMALLLVLSASFMAVAQKNGAGFERGRVDAIRDVQSGFYKLQRVHGDLGKVNCGGKCDYPSRDDLYESVLKDKYKIDVVSVWIGDVGNWDAEIDYANGYNSVSKPAIESKYGAEVFSEAYKQAEVDFEHKYSSQEKTCKKAIEDFVENVRRLPASKPN